jgi:hypothetical protein
VPQADICTAAKKPLFDHLVSAGDERRRHFEAERLRGLEVNHQLVLRRCLHRQVCGLLALEDAIDVVGCPTILFDRIGTIRDQAAIGGEVATGGRSQAGGSLPQR